MYLRKSRADFELEKDGIDTLERHKKTLLEYADRNKLVVSKIYSEVVSGETISSRPEMQKLLKEIEERIWDAVLVMEVERLARGDTIDQGVVAKTFKLSNTKIITPNKIYNPNNEFDEEYFEFGLFMSRREYKTINRRLQNGRLLSVKEGKYMGSIPPYGYSKKRLKPKGYTLKIIEEEANIVKHIFSLCLKGYSMTMIASELNNIGISPKNKTYWTASTIDGMLKNPIYIGKIRWNYRKTKQNIINSEVVKTRPINKDYLLIDGLHQPIIDDYIFNKAQNILNSKVIKRVPLNKELQNPLAGLIICGKCDKKMIRKPDKKGKHLLFCPTRNCSAGSYLSLVEEKVEEVIKERFKDKNLFDYEDGNEKYLLEKELIKNENILLKIYDLFEAGVYDKKVFLERKKKAENTINNIKDKRVSIEVLKPKPSLSEFFIKENIKNKYHFYSKTIDKIIYTKEKGGKYFKDAFSLEIHLKT